MKGLLMKDLYFTMQQKKMLLIIAVLFVMFCITQGSESGPFIISYVTMMGGMFVLSTITYDEFDNSMSYLFTLPVTREDYVKEKYLFGILGVSGFWSVSTFACLLMDFQNLGENLFMSAIILVIMLIFEMVMLPIQLKFGGDKGRIVLVGIVAGGILLINFGKKMIDRLVEENIGIEVKINEILEWASKIQPWVYAIIALTVLMAVILISYQMSLKIIKKKEY